MSIVDTMELGPERQEWRRVVEMLRTKPLQQRSDLEMSRMLTLVSRFKVLSQLSFEARLAVCKSLYFERVAQKGVEVISANELHSYQGPWRLVISGSIETRVPGLGRTRQEVGRGEHLGDALTLRSLPEKSAYVTKEACDFLCLKHDDYQRLLGHLEDRELDARVQFFGEGLLVPIFASWGPYQLRELAKRAYPRRYASRTVVVREREEGQDLFFIRHGECRVVREIEFSEHTKQGAPPRRTVKLLELALLTQGEHFGELALHDIHVDRNGRYRAEAQPKRKLATSGGAARGGNRRRGEGRSGGRHRPVQGAEGGGGAAPGALSDDSDDSGDSGADPSELDPSKVQQPTSTAGVRQATVFSHTPLELLVVPAAAARELITGNPLQRMLQYAKGYPTAQEIRSQFMAQHDWATFKQNLVSDIISVECGRF